MKTTLIAFTIAGTAFAQQYTISTVAGGAPPATPAAALNTSIGQPRKLVFSGGNLYFSSGNSVFKIDASGSLTLVAGNSRAGFSGDGGPAVSAKLNAPKGLAIDSGGNLYIADSLNNRVRKVDTSGIITLSPVTAIRPFPVSGAIRDQPRMPTLSCRSGWQWIPPERFILPRRPITRSAR